MSLYQRWQDWGLPEAENRALYVLAEMAPDNGLIHHLEFHETEHRCLWQSDDRPQLYRHAPYLVQIAKDSAFDHWINEQLPAIPYSVIHSIMPLDGLARQLKKFARFSDPETKRKYHLRLGNSKALAFYLSANVDDPMAAIRLFANGRIRAYAFYDPGNDLQCRAEARKAQDNASSGEKFIHWQALEGVRA